MALSWNELNIDHKIVFLLESLVNEKYQQAPIACRSCDEIFFDNKSLLNHFRSHFHEDGTFNGRPLAGSFAPPGNISNFILHSSSLPVNASNYVAHENLEAFGWQNVSPHTPDLSLGNSPVPTLLKNAVQLRENTLNNRPLSYLSPSIFCSSIGHGTFSSQFDQSSNFHSRFASKPTGPLNILSPIRPLKSDVLASEPTEQLSFSFPKDPGASTSQPIQQFNLCSPITVGSCSLQSIPGTNGLALGTTRNEMEGPFPCHTKQYIKQLERPIQEIIVVHDDMAGNDNPDEMDLALNL